ncbi:MAG: hypothetical protein C5B59_00400 [Bacteroidetes bacterium]|nr:MAG: hypothetical protein C5B59_00400 [Bacteroidota bacterium]
MYYLKLTGTIPEGKQREFEQTYRFMITQIPETCTGFNISRDVMNNASYHIMSYWKNAEALRSFAKTSIYQMLIGAFNTLGKLRELTEGQMTESINGILS